MVSANTAASDLGFAVVGDAVQNFLVGGFFAFPAQHFDPLAFFKVFVVLKEVSDRVAAHRVHI